MSPNQWSEEYKLRILSDLLSSDGWKLVDNWLEFQNEIHINKVLSADNADARALNVGYCKAFQLMRTYFINYAKGIQAHQKLEK